MYKYKKAFLLIVFCILFFNAQAQRISVGTNIAQYVNLGTINAEVNFATSQHLSVLAGTRYNNWQFNTDNEHLVVQNRQKTAYAGCRYWPWYVFSEWWFEVKGQFSDFQSSGIWRPALNTGTAVGCGLAAGYTRMIHERLNIEFGAGFWGGYMLKHTLYQCPVCLDIRETGPKPFVLPDEIKISLIYVLGDE